MVGRTNALTGSFRLIVSDYIGVYDGQGHSITAYVPSQYESTTTIQYSTNNISWSNTCPTRTDAGSTTIYISATNPSFDRLTDTATITINPAPVTLTANSDTVTYNRSSHSVNGYTSSIAGLYFSGVYASGSGTNAGTYSVTFTGVNLNVTTDSTGNAVITEVINGTLTINKASAASLGLSVSSYSGSYDGSAHTVSASVSNYTGTTIYYSTSSSGPWSTTAPTRTEKGTTTVYVKAENNNYETATASGTIIITDPPRTVITLNWTPNASRMMAITAPTKGTTTYTSGYVQYEVPETGIYIISGINVTPSNPIIQVNSLYGESYYCEGQL